MDLNVEIEELTMDQLSEVSAGGDSNGGHNGTGPGTGKGDGMGWLRNAVKWAGPDTAGGSGNIA
jgi:hypothetical protein